jgi:hypothetical protein
MVLIEVYCFRSAQNSPPGLNSNLAQLLLGDGAKADSPTLMLQEEDKLSTTLVSHLLQKVKLPEHGMTFFLDL